MKKNIAILIGFLPVPRIYKRIELEKKSGNLHLICWDKKSNMLFPPDNDGYETHIITIKAGSDPLKRLVPYYHFSVKARKVLRKLQPDLIHVQGLDMLKIAVAYKKESKKNVSIIYEVADLHRLIIDDQQGFVKKTIGKYLRWEDKRLEKKYDLLIITSMRFNDIYFKHFVPGDKILFMPNVPKMSVFANYSKKSNSEFTVGYIGSVRYKKQMMNLIEAADRCGIQLLIAGFEDEPVELESICKRKKNIDWIGKFDFETQVSNLYSRCDAIYSVYDADLQNVKVALPNKLYEAVFCELPIIVAKGTYLSEIVDDWGVGLSVSHTDVDELCDALQILRDKDRRYKQIVDNCKKHKIDVTLGPYNEKLEDRIKNLLAQ